MITLLQQFGNKTINLKITPLCFSCKSKQVTQIWLGKVVYSTYLTNKENVSNIFQFTSL